MSVTSNDLKKGTRVILFNGWEAQLLDNKKGNIRMAEVYGDYTEMGSIYATDIAYAYLPNNPTPVSVTATTKQVKAQQLRAAFGL